MFLKSVLWVNTHKEFELHSGITLFLPQSAANRQESLLQHDKKLL